MVLLLLTQVVEVEVLIQPQQVLVELVAAVMVQLAQGAQVLQTQVVVLVVDGQQEAQAVQASASFHTQTPITHLQH
jgi:hypothetical protein